jgi:hypothetical protein
MISIRTRFYISAGCAFLFFFSLFLADDDDAVAVSFIRFCFQIIYYYYYCEDDDDDDGKEEGRKKTVIKFYAVCDAHFKHSSKFYNN